MSLLKRLFSSHYRQALSCEGSGHYVDAAKHYLMAGERFMAARMSRLAARDERDPHRRVDMIRRALDALDTVDPEEEDIAPVERAMERDLADALVFLVDQSNLMDRRDRSHLEEAARIYQAHDAHLEAGEVFARLGYKSRAMEAFKIAGDITRMEEMFTAIDAQDLGESAYDNAWDSYEFARLADDPIGAIEALERCLHLRPHDAALLTKLHNLRQAMPKARRVALRCAKGHWTLVGGPQLRIGREDTNELLLMDPGVSRAHATLTLRDGVVSLEDLGSSHGTWCGDMRLHQAHTLDHKGQLRLGKETTLNYGFLAPGELPATFEVASGHLKGQRFTWAQHILTTGDPQDAPAWIPPGLALRFTRGFWHVDPTQSLAEIRCGRETLITARLLRLQDEITFEGVTLIVE